MDPAARLAALRVLANLGYAYLPPDECARYRDGEEGALLAAVTQSKLRDLNADPNPAAAVGAAVARLRDAPPAAARELLVHGCAFGGEGGPAGPTLRYVDWADPARNAYHVTDAMRVRSPGRSGAVALDLVLFVNGAPLAVLALAGDDLVGATGAAIDRQVRTQRDPAAAAVYATAQVLGALGPADARYALPGAPAEQWRRWRERHDDEPARARHARELRRVTSARLPPATRRRAGAAAGEPIVADGEIAASTRLLVDVFAPGRLLALVRDYTVQTPRGRRLADAPRLAAVRRAAAGLLGGGHGGGVVWHAHGTDDALTPVLLARELLTHPDLAGREPRIVLASDRPGLPATLRSALLDRGVDAPTRVVTATGLRRWLEAGGAAAVVPTAKLESLARALRRLRPAPAGEVVLLVDELHRTRYARFGGSLDSVLPGARAVAFATTPPGELPGPLAEAVDRYRVAEAVADGALVPVLREDRSAGAAEEGAAWVAADVVDHLAGKLATHRLRVRGRWRAPRAQLLVRGEEEARRYGRLLSGAESPTIRVGGTPGGPPADGERPELVIVDLEADERPTADPRDLALYLVADALGPDLLGEVMRVARPARGKGYGYVVDYRGTLPAQFASLAEGLVDAADAADAADVRGAVRPIGTVVADLPRRRAAALAPFGEAADLPRADASAWTARLRARAARAGFFAALRSLLVGLRVAEASAGWSASAAAPEREGYRADRGWLLAVAAAAQRRFGERVDLTDVGGPTPPALTDVFATEAFAAELAALGDDLARADTLASRLALHLRGGSSGEGPRRRDELLGRLAAATEAYHAGAGDAADFLAAVERVRRDVLTGGVSEGVPPELRGRPLAVALHARLAGEFGAALGEEGAARLPALALRLEEAIRAATTVGGEERAGWRSNGRLVGQLRLEVFDAVYEAGLFGGTGEEAAVVRGVVDGLVGVAREMSPGRR